MKNELPLILPTTPVANPKKNSRTRKLTRALPRSRGPCSPGAECRDPDQHDQGEEDQLEDEPDDVDRQPERPDQREHDDREVQPGVIHEAYVSGAQAPATGSSNGRARGLARGA